MMDLITKAAVKEDHQKWLGYLDEDMITRLNIAVDKYIPSAFDGMTFGEVFDSIVDVDNDCEGVYGENGLMWFAFSQERWNSLYKKEVRE